MQHEPQNEPNTSMHSQPSSAEQNAAVDAALGIDRTKCPKCGSVAGWDQKNGCIECGHRLKKQPAQQQEPVSAIRALTDQCAALIQERDELQKQVWRYEKNGVTCQTYRHKIDRTCSECNVQEDYTSPQPAQQEPVATGKQFLQVEELLKDMLDTLPYNSPDYWISRIKEVLPLYTSPQPAQQQYQSTADKCELTPVPAKGGLLPAQQQEPVGEVFINTGSGALFAPMKDVRWKDGKMPPEGAKLYTSPQPIKPEQQEPVAWMDGYRNIYSLEEKAAGCEDAIIPLVPATLQHWSDCAVHNEPAYPAGKCDCGGYTSPPAERSAERTPRKPWAGLTAADRKQLLHDHHPDIDPVAFFDAVEAKLKEKNA